MDVGAVGEQGSWQEGGDYGQSEKRFTCSPCEPREASWGDEVNEVGLKPKTRAAQVEFNEADVRKPLASARAVAKAGNGIWLDENGGYIMNLETGECMDVKVVNDVYAFDVQLDDQSEDTITLDSGAGCSVWPHGRHAGHAKMTEKKKGIGMVAANGAAIAHYGQRTLSFKGVKSDDQGFTGRVWAVDQICRRTS